MLKVSKIVGKSGSTSDSLNQVWGSIPGLEHGVTNGSTTLSQKWTELNGRGITPLDYKKKKKQYYAKSYS